MPVIVDDVGSGQARVAAIGPADHRAAPSAAVTRARLPATFGVRVALNSAAFMPVIVADGGVAAAGSSRGSDRSSRSSRGRTIREA